MAKYGSPEQMGKAIAAGIREAAKLAAARRTDAERDVIEAAKALHDYYPDDDSKQVLVDGQLDKLWAAFRSAVRALDSEEE